MRSCVRTRRGWRGWKLATTNHEIETAFNATLHAAGLGYDIGWHGVDFTPPADAVWLEPRHLPNSDTVAGYGLNASVLKTGIYSITVYGRSGAGLADLHIAAEAVKGVFPRGLMLAGGVRVTRTYIGSADVYEDKVYQTVTVEYSGS